MKNKIFALEEVLDKFHDGQSIMFGDLHGEISAEEIISGLIEKNVKNLTAIACTSGQPDMGVGRLVANHQVSKFMATHIGLNPNTRDQLFSGEMEVEFIPQGTFAERIVKCCVRGGHLYVPGHDKKGVFKISLFHSTDVTLVDFGFSS